ncbi:MAG: hypothetical protein ACKN9V_05050, partial [Pseudomonadota bacterium]
YFINGLLALFESDFNPDWLKWAQELTDHVLSEFWDSKNLNFFYTPKTHEALIFRPKEYQDGALPSATAMMVTALVRLGKLQGNPLYLEQAEKVLLSHSHFMAQAPLASSQFMIALELLKNRSKELVLVPGKDEDSEKEFLAFIRGNFYPNVVTHLKTDPKNELPTAYICEQQSCKPPITSLSELKKALDE